MDFIEDEADSVCSTPKVKTIPMWQIVLRWILFLPGAIVCALLASFFIRMANHIGMNWMYGLNSDSIRSKLWDNIIASGAMGAAFVYGGARIAPSSRKIVAYSLTLVLLLLAGFIAYPNVMQRNWWIVAGLVAMGIGGGILAYSVAAGDCDLDADEGIF